MMAEQFTEEEEAAMGVFRTQLLTSRNIHSHWWSHWFHGGLERQIEHHLFPQLPRHQLSRVAPKVRRYDRYDRYTRYASSPASRPRCAPSRDRRHCRYRRYDRLQAVTNQLLTVAVRPPVAPTRRRTSTMLSFY